MSLPTEAFPYLNQKFGMFGSVEDDRSLKVRLVESAVKLGFVLVWYSHPTRLGFMMTSLEHPQQVTNSTGKFYRLPIMCWAVCVGSRRIGKSWRSKHTLCRTFGDNFSVLSSEHKHLKRSFQLTKCLQLRKGVSHVPQLRKDKKFKS